MTGALRGRTVLIPDSAIGTSGVLTALVSVGARPLIAPLSQARPVRDFSLVDDALQAIRAGRYGWLAVASAAAVRILDQRAQTLFASEPVLANLLSLVAVGNLRVAAVGTSTVAVLRALGIEPATPLRGSGPVALLAPLLADADGSRVLFARGNLVGPALVGGLRGCSINVDEVVTYMTARDEAPPSAVISAWSTGQVDAVLLTSPKDVRGLVDRLGPPPPRTKVACSDRETAGTATSYGIRVDAVGSLPSVSALVQALNQETDQLSIR